VRLGPTEQARLLVFNVAELARRERDRGLRLNAPEAIALACDAMHMAARAGARYDEVVEAGMAAVSPGDLLDGVAALIGEIRLEVVLDEGTRLVVLRGVGAPAAGAVAATGGDAAPGAVVVAEGSLVINEGLSSLELEVTNDSDHQVRVSSHFPFDRVNARLSFDREAARGARLDIPAGDTTRWGPGERKVVRLIRIRAERPAAEGKG
jgi:urease subunit gamma/beta